MVILIKYVVRRRLGVFDEHVEVAILVEHAGVEQFVFELLAAAAAVGFDEISRTGIPLADTCRDTSCTSASASSRDRSSIP